MIVQPDDLPEELVAGGGGLPAACVGDLGDQPAHVEAFQNAADDTALPTTGVRTWRFSEKLTKK